MENKPKSEINKIFYFINMIAKYLTEVCFPVKPEVNKIPEYLEFKDQFTNNISIC